MNNGLWRGFVVVILAAIVVLAYPLLRQHVPYLKAHTKTYATIFPLKIEQDTTPVKVALKDSTILKDTLVSVEIDSAYLDSLDKANYLDSIDQAAAVGLTSFFRSLSQLAENPSKKVKIVWFGDSMIEGDMITQDVRDSLQRRFGGSGVGYMPITSVVNRFRNTIRHEFSENWSSYTVVGGEQPDFPMNWNGEYFTAPTDTLDSIQGYTHTTVTYRRSGAYDGTKILPYPTLIYGKRRVADSLYIDSANYAFYHNDTLALSGTEPVNFLPLSDSSLKTVELEFDLKPDQVLYGMSFSSNSGIELSNLASRGNSGMVLSGIKADILKGMSGAEPPSLIVLQYGVNASSLGVTTYDWYKRAMIRVVSYLQKVYPTTSIVVVSMADRNANINGTMQTDSSVFAMNEVLLEVATTTGASYFDLYAKMGGKNSMKEWVEAEKPLANKDYTHFNSRGSKKVADLFIAFLMNQYSAYLEKQTEEEEKPKL
tara:strand:- start:3089 stop:4537 length:1449 start_codon:yes stop_codon:yes gene_type:complete